MTSSAESSIEVGGELFRGMHIGRYEVLTQLSVGGMAELFLGFTAGPGGFRKYIVIKKILPDARDNEQFVRMFLDEARLTAAFSHPNIGQVFELGQDAGELFLAMEFIAGQNLNQVIGACAKARAVLPLGFTAAVAHDVALALHYAHTFTAPDGATLPVIHRDIAQKNVMVTYDGQVKLLDFGIAKARGSLGRTSVGIVKGTTGYMSPEQVSGLELDGRSDVFSLGVVMYEMFTGQRLFAAETEIDEMKAVLEQPVPVPHEIAPVVPVALSDIVLKALAKDREQRFSSAKELAKALASLPADALYDQERRAAFMREHFASEERATQALLQSASTPSREIEVVQAAVKAMRPEPQLAAEPPAQPAAEPKVPASSPPARKAKPKPRPSANPPKAQAVAAPAPKQRDTDEHAMMAVAVQQQALAAKIATPPSGSGVLLPLGVLVGIVIAGALIFRSVFGFDVASHATGPAPAEVMPRFVPKEASSPDDPKPLRDFDALAAAPAVKPEPVPVVDAGSPVAADPARPTVRQGEFTLITFPEATVFKGKQKLGMTPLFNAKLPVGTHVLTLVGNDGKKHLLSMPVTSGKVTPMKVSLADLPTR